MNFEEIFFPGSIIVERLVTDGKERTRYKLKNDK
jgi:hypothetical protein